MTGLPARLALDTNIFIYALDPTASEHEASRTVLQAIDTHGIEVFCTSLLLAELTIPYFRTGGTQAARKLAADLMVVPWLCFLPLDSEVALEAARLRAQHGLRMPDAVHLGTALVAGAAAFVTNDRRLRRVQGEPLHIMLLDEACERAKNLAGRS